MKRYGLSVAVVILLGANAIALILAAQNRAGGSVQTIELTERELALQSEGQENSGVALRLRWHRQTATDFFGRAQMEAIGFDYRIPEGRTPKDILLLPRMAYVVLEYEGKAWEKWSQGPEDKRPQDREVPVPRSAATRLFPVDVSRNMSELRRRYPDQSKYLIVAATLEARIQDVKDPETGAIQQDQCVGQVMAVLPSDINVPLPFAKLLGPLTPEPKAQPRYTVTLAYGRNLEPWVTSVKIK